MVKLLSSNITIIMAKYIIEPKKTLKKWVKPFVQINNLDNFEYIYCRDNINLDRLSKSNTIMAKLILKYSSYKINWDKLAMNPSKWAYKLLKPTRINLYLLAGNSSKWAYKLLKNNMAGYCWDILSVNTGRWAYKLLNNRPDKIDWFLLSGNPSKWACKILKNNLDKFCCHWLSNNPGEWACKLLKSINWNYLSENPSKWAYKILKSDFDKINIYLLSSNPSKWAYKILKNIPDEIDWNDFSSHPYIFKIIKNNKYYKLFDNLYNALSVAS